MKPPFIRNMPPFRALAVASLAVWLPFAPPLLAQSVPTADLAARPWLDVQAPIDRRVDALLSEMTLEEKIGQMWQVNGFGAEPTGDMKEQVAESQLYAQIKNGEIGSVLNEIHLSALNEMQRVAVEQTRLGIPLVFGRDVIHGYRTIFPIPLGQAASWNRELVEQAAAVAAREARSEGIHWTFAPMVDIARDPRWGRIAEGAGEDPYLASQLAAAMVRGFQGDDFSAPDRLIACAKHFAGYGAAEGGRDYNTCVISTSLLHNVYLPPFRAAVEAGVGTLMTSFGEINGVPCSGDPELLETVLRDRWNFRGFVVSDWTSIEEMIPHGFSADGKAAARAAAQAGVNMEMVSTNFHDHLQSLVENGALDESRIDELVAEILRVKFRAGLFEQPYTQAPEESLLLAEEHLQVTRQLARQSMVLLKNENNTLPLNKDSLRRIAVIGPLADAQRDQLGTWIPDGKAEQSRTPWAALKETVGEGMEIEYLPALEDDLDRSTEKFAEAVAAARDADVVLLFVGERANLSGEARSRATLDLPGAQPALVEAIAEVGTPVVMVVQAGRPLTIGHQLERVDAVLYAWHAGTMTGPALCDLLWGAESPSGKLPVTMLKTVGQVPLYYNHKNTGRPPRAYDFPGDRKIDTTFDFELGYNSNYLEIGPYPLFPFGFGLSYTTFEYGDAELSTDTLRAGQTLAVRVPVTNTGDVAAEEIVQLYVRDLVGGLTRPVRELKAFRRVGIKPGETVPVEFSLSTDQLSYYNNDAEEVLEPGEFEIYVGGHSAAPLAGKFELVE